MNAKLADHGMARCPARSVQEVIRADGDADSQPESYKLVSYEFRGDEDIPFEHYTSPEFFKREVERMWSRTWQWACREEHIPNEGDYYVYDVGPYSLIITRTAGGAIRAYHNACLHRGTKLKPSFSAGWTAKLACPFHGWTWDLEGKLSELPCAWDFPHVDKAKRSLPEALVGTWGGFVFVNMDIEAMPLEDYLAPLPEHAAHADLQDRYVALHVQKELPCNWKVASEAFVESYHTPVTHSQLQKGTGDVNTQYDTFSAHVNRLFSLAGVASPNAGEGVSEQEIIDTMVLGKSLDGGLKVPEGGNARKVMAEYFKGVLKAGGKDVDNRSVSEIIDTVGYFVFPNGHFFLAPSFPITYRFRPLGMDPTRALFDLLLLAPLPNGERPPPYETVRIGINDSYTTVPGMDHAMGVIFDQDTGNMGWMQEGMAASRRTGATLGNFQESRIRHIHETLRKYLA
jgi:phenylpropionate dioxygenase-like ring-hydroxylating dioxygenase large terminal subunit